jgi:hypothetical protein
MIRRKATPESELVLPPTLAARFDQLDEELPPTPRWRPAGPAVEAPRSGSIRVRRRSDTTTLGTLTAGVLAVVVVVGALGVASRIATGPGVDRPSGVPAGGSPVATPDGAVARGSEAPTASGPFASSSASLPATVAPAPSGDGKPLPLLHFRTLKLVDRPDTVENILAGDLGWACPVRVPPPTELTPAMLTKVLAAPSPSRGFRKANGFVVWLGSDPEAAALGYGASLVIRDGTGDLWLLIRSTGMRVQRLERVVADGGKVAWWLADVVAAGTCPEPSPTRSPTR